MSQSAKHTAASHVMDLTSFHDDDLILLRAGLDAEMRKRNIAFTVGGVGERLVIEHFKKTPGLPKLQAAPRGTKNMDAISRNGERYSIKSRLCTSKARKTGTIYQPEQDKHNRLFEYLLIVVLAEDWSLQSIHQLTWNDFVKVRSWDKRMNAWYVAISQRTLGAAKLIYQAPGKNA
jgi:hypothetical protein